MRLKEEEVCRLQREVNPIKSQLIQIARDLQNLSPRKTRSLETIIARLEEWQNTT